MHGEKRIWNEKQHRHEIITKWFFRCLLLLFQWANWWCIFVHQAWNVYRVYSNMRSTVAMRLNYNWNALTIHGVSERRWNDVEKKERRYTYVGTLYEWNIIIVTEIILMNIIVIRLKCARQRAPQSNYCVK